MEDYMSYDYLWQLCQKEKQTNQLLLIPKTFYEDMSDFITSLDPTNEKSAQIKANATKLLSELFESRKQKILFYVAHGRALPQPISTMEAEFYDSIAQVMKSSRIELGSTKSNHTSLKSLVDIPEIMLPSGNKLGPLKKDQLLDAKLSDADLNFLLANAICANSE
jgi:DNA replication initiation complex subunit (GINS family)